MHSAIAKMESLGATASASRCRNTTRLLASHHVGLRSPHRDGTLFRDASSQRADKELRRSWWPRKPPPCRPRSKQEIAIVDGMNSQAYKDRMLNRDKLRLAVAKIMADNNLDAILYPHQKILVVPVRLPTISSERNGTLSNGTGFPGGHVSGRILRADSRRRRWASPSAPNCWVSTTAKTNCSPYAYAFEQAAHPRNRP